MSQISKILRETSRNEFNSVLQRVGGPGQNPPEWSILTSTGSAKSIHVMRVNYVNKLRALEGFGLIELPEELPTEPDEEP